MSLQKHDDDCPGCRPALVNTKTGQPYPANSPQMIAVMKVWNQTNLIERQAWHRVTCQNSRSPSDLRLAGSIAEKVKEALKGVS